MSQQLRQKLVEVANGKNLVDTEDPHFMISEWESRPHGAQVAIVYTFSEKSGPIATPVIWMANFEGTKEDQIRRAIDRIKRNEAYGNN